MKTKYVVTTRFNRDGTPNSGEDQELGRYPTLKAAEAAIRKDVMSDFTSSLEVEELGKQNYASYYAIEKVEEVKIVRPDIWVRAEVRMETVKKGG